MFDYNMIISGIRNYQSRKIVNINCYSDSKTAQTTIDLLATFMIKPILFYDLEN